MSAGASVILGVPEQKEASLVNSTLWIVYAALFVVLVIAGWKIFVKAGEEGWKAIIPIWNTLIVLKIVGREWWWIILLIIPLVGFVIWIIVALDVAKSYGRGTGFGIGIALLPFIFFPILGFGTDQYKGPAVTGGAALA
jgi:Family of unknown function (DUF5684)